MNKARKEKEVFEYKTAHRNYIKINGKIMAYAVYVAQNNPSICGIWKDGSEVHHINGDTLDDRPENLIVLSKEDHHKIHRKPVDAFYVGDEGIEYIGRYGGVNEAAKSLNVPASTISYYCKHTKPISSTWERWRFSYYN